MSTGNYLPIIILSLVGFLLLAVLLLAPVYFFLKREQKASQKWTKEELAKQIKDHPSPNGSTTKRSETET